MKKNRREKTHCRPPVDPSATEKHEIEKLKRQQENIMAQLDDLTAKMAAIQTGVTNLGTLLAQAVSDVTKSFADLKAAIIAGAPDLTQPLADADRALAAIATIATSLQALDTAAVAADPVPPVA